MNNEILLEGSPNAINEAGDEEKCMEVSAAAAEKDCRGGCIKHGPQFMAMEK